ncbi:MAG: tetratricopeptide repeat protein [Spirochaetaceae bacterium]|jgi:tetratricopeptide (TPR) repeat protein|nr:tetratricopeptide repeat protein [Spirochaetaceae bacterium]
MDYAMNNLNADSYKDLDWVLSDSDRGFYFVIAPAAIQGEIAEPYRELAAVYDYKKERGRYSFNTLESWIQHHAFEKTLFLLNFDLAIQEEADIKRLNMSRDMLAHLNKNCIFFVTQYTDDKLAKGALDFYSFIKLRIHFEDDSPVIHEKPLIIPDKSTGVDYEVDFTKSKQNLLANAIMLMNKAEKAENEFRYTDALTYLHKALEIQEKLLGKENPDPAATYHNIALVYDSMGEYRMALEWYNKSLAIREKVLGKEHPFTAATYNNIATVYSHMGEYPKALEWYNKALAILEKVLGKEHPDTAATYNNIASVYSSMGEYPNALEWYEKALAIQEKVLGIDHPNTAKTHSNIAFVYSHQGKYEDALALYRPTYKILRHKLGENHPDTKKRYNNILDAYLKSGLPPADFDSWLSSPDPE